MTSDIVLASASPRRKELLESLGLDFLVITSGVDEINCATGDPAELAAGLALAKAEEVANRAPGRLILGADTVVIVDGEILGKPADKADARRMLALLRGRWHQVITGVTIFDTDSRASDTRTVRTRVRMARYTDRQIEEYIVCGEPMDKAGSYAIQGQGGALVAAVDGCYTNVVGLPVCEVVRLLRRFGVEPRAAAPVCRDASGAPCPRLGEE
jgi:septum formation protein